MIAVNVMYPNEDGGTFDEDYYFGTHIPMVQNHWGPMGLKGARIIKGLAGGTPGAPAPYILIAQVLFDSVEDFQQAAAAHGDEIFGDVPNFTNLTPVVQVSDIVVDA